MHFFSITLLSLSAATLTHANPLQDSYQLQPRAAKDVVCDGVRTYTPQEVNRALQQACRYQNQGVTVPKKKKKGAYPHDFENREKVRLAVEGPWMEFPIMEDGSAYDGEYNEGKTGTDRIIFVPHPRGRCELAGVVTHSGADQGGFLPCTPIVPKPPKTFPDLGY